jgi:hypothetical protein
MSALEIAASHPDLRTRSLHPALERMARVGKVVRRKNAVTQRWEYARAPKR